MNPGDLANWKCVCGKGPSIDHQVNGHCEFKRGYAAARSHHHKAGAMKCPWCGAFFDGTECMECPYTFDAEVGE
jgi:hypothetical protein